MTEETNWSWQAEGAEKRRRNPNMAEKLDAALLALLEAQGAPIGRDEARSLLTGAVASRFDFDHWPVRFADGGSTHASNLTPRLRAEHRKKTAKRDIPEMAKSKRLVKKRLAHDDVMRAKVLGGLRGDVEEIQSGREPRKKAAIRSPGFDKTRSKRFDGKIVLRREAN